jgi:two-component sensor histidine kinase
MGSVIGESDSSGDAGGTARRLRRPVLAAASIALATAFLTAAFEVLKEILAPGLTKWQSHAVTVVFAGLASALVALAALGRFRAVNESLRCEAADRLKAEREVRGALEERMALFRELQHRVKNSFTMISSLIHLTRTEGKTEESRELLSDVGDRVDAISELYDMLHSAGSMNDVDLDSYLSRILGLLARESRIGASADLAAGRIETSEAVPIGLIVTELMTNAIKHAFPDGRQGKVELRAARAPEGLAISFSDDGVGLPEGVDPSSSRSIGLTIIRTLVDQLDGKFEVSASCGTTWSFIFPVKAPRIAAGASGGASPARG